MRDIYSVVEGNFGKVVVHELTQNLVTHAHSEMQLVYWQGGGSARCRVGEATAVINEGEIVACNSYESHDIVLTNTSEPVIALMLDIDVAWLDDSNYGWKKPVQFSCGQISSTTEIKEFSNALMRKILSSSDLESLCVEADVVKLFSLTVAQTTNASHNTPPRIRRRMPDYRLRLALSYMKENIKQVSLMGNVAERVGVSRSRLYELFFDEIKSSPKVIWNSMRMDEAMQQIAVSDESMATIAINLGFSSAGNFSRFFKANAGVSPLAYRKAMAWQRNQQQIFSIIYTSVATRNLSEKDLENILLAARQRNEKHQVTGVLLYSDGRFMQYLEGASSDLHEILAHVKSAKQHGDLEFGVMTPIDRRAYKSWSMAFVAPQIYQAEPVLLDREMGDFLNQSRQRA